MTQLTETQAEALAPDEAALYAARSLARGNQWLTTARSERGIWGEMQGSGKNPYRAQVDLATLEVAFKCSCPSRKFPCKHSLSLLLLYVKEGKLFSPTAEPDWVQTWLDQRQSKKQTPTNANDDNNEPNNDSETDKKTKDKEKRSQTQLDRAQNGIAELSLWLSDLIHGGLLALPEKSAAYFEQMSTRMIDAGMPGLSNTVRKLRKINYLDTSVWHAEALKIVGDIALIVTAFERIEQLPAAMQAEVRNQIGFKTQKADLLNDPNAATLQDQWLVLSRTLLPAETDPTLMEQRILLYGLTHRRFALLLDHGFKIAPNTPELVTFEPSAIVTANLIFFPAATPFRALVRQVQDAQLTLPQTLETHADFHAAHLGFVHAQQQNPWLDGLLQVVQNVAITSENLTWLLRDVAGFRLPIHQKVERAKVYQLLAMTGGAPVTLFFTRQDAQAIPHGVVLGAQFIAI